MLFSRSKPPRQTVAQFLNAHARRGRILAPASFVDAFPDRVVTYGDRPTSHTDLDWAVLHKGQLKKLDPLLLLTLDAHFLPVFADEVFVVFAREPHGPIVPYDSTHLIAFRQRRAEAIAHQWERRGGAAGGLTPPALRQIHHAQSVYLGNSQALTHTALGHKLIVNTEDISLTPHLLSEGKWEPWVTRVFQQQITPGMTVVDVGANIGYYTVLAASLVTRTGRVYSFEANPQLHRILWKNANINGMGNRVTTVNQAVFERSQTLRFSQLKAFQGSGSVHALDALDAAGQRQQQTYIREHYQDDVTFYEVEAIALDEYFDSDTAIDFIKIDAEGSEPYIFKGMQQLIARQPRLQVVFEFYPQLFEGTGHDPRQFLQGLQQDGFTLQAISHREGIVAASMDRLLSGEFQELFIAKGHALDAA